MAVMCLMLQENPIKDINVNLSFLSLGSKVVEWTPPGTGVWWKFGKIYFSMYCPVMHANLQSTFSPSPEGHLKMLIYSMFY